MKRSISGNKTDEDGGGEDIFHFSEPHTVQSVKKSLRSAAEEMGNHLDKDTQELVINEGIRVFELNNTLINRYGHRRSFIRNNKLGSQALLGIRKTLQCPLDIATDLRQGGWGRYRQSGRYIKGL